MRDPQRVVITGLGPVTSIGIGAAALWEAMRAGRSNVVRRRLLVDVASAAQIPVAAMPQLSDVPGLDALASFLSGQGCEAYRDLGYSLLATQLALADAKLAYDRDHNTIGVVQAFEAPGIERAVSQLFEIISTPLPMDAPPALYDVLAPRFYNAQPFLYVHLVSKAFGLHGFATSVHNACSSGAFAIEMAAERIRSGAADVMIVVGGESFDTAVRLEWFRRLDLYADEQIMRPFDEDAAGFYVGEGAGAIVLESQAHAAARGATAYGEYVGGAFAQQGWKQAYPDVRAGRLCDVIARAMSSCGVAAGDLDLIVPHGAATTLSDKYESTCFARALKGEKTAAVATVFKPYFGHMLAASGVVEVIATMLAMRNGHIPATLHTRAERAQFAAPLITGTGVDRSVKTVLKLSTGFTGHDAAGVYRAV